MGFLQSNDKYKLFSSSEKTNDVPPRIPDIAAWWEKATTKNNPKKNPQNNPKKLGFIGLYVLANENLKIEAHW